MHSSCTWLLSKKNHWFILYALSFSGSHYRKIIDYDPKYPSQVGMDLQASSSQTPGSLPPLITSCLRFLSQLFLIFALKKKIRALTAQKSFCLDTKWEVHMSVKLFYSLFKSDMVSECYSCSVHFLAHVKIKSSWYLLRNSFSMFKEYVAAAWVVHHFISP